MPMTAAREQSAPSDSLIAGVRVERLKFPSPEARASSLFYRASYRKTASHFSGRTLRHAAERQGRPALQIAPANETKAGGAVTGQDSSRLSTEQPRKDQGATDPRELPQTRGELEERLRQNVRHDDVERSGLIGQGGPRAIANEKPDVRGAVLAAILAGDVDGDRVKITAAISGRCAKALAAAMARTPDPVPRSSTDEGLISRLNRSSAMRHPLVVP